MSSDEPSFTPHHFCTETRFLPGRGPSKVPKIILSREAYTLMALYVELGDQEVGWLGTAIRLENGDFRIEKVMLFKQQVSGTETEISTEGLQDLAMELIGRGEEGITDWNNMRFWGHSHVRMGTSPSGTDENTMMKNRWGSRSGDGTFCFENSDYPWAIRGIFNKLGRAQFSLFLYEEGLRLDDVAWEVDAPTATTPQPEALAVLELPVAAVDTAALGWTPSASNDRLATDSAPNAVVDVVRSGGNISARGGSVPTASSAGSADVNGNVSGSTVGTESAGKTPGDLTAATDGKSAGDADGEKPKPWLRRVFTRPPRDRRYTPDITAALRATVEAEFRTKVKSRFASFRFFGGGSDDKDNKPTSGMGSLAGDTLNDGVVEGEASGPGTTGIFGSGTGLAGEPRSYGRAPGQCPETAQVARYGCNCSRCASIRRRDAHTVAPGHFEPPARREFDARNQEPESVLVTLGRFLADWFQR